MKVGRRSLRLCSRTGTSVIMDPFPVVAFRRWLSGTSTSLRDRAETTETLCHPRNGPVYPPRRTGERTQHDTGTKLLREPGHNRTTRACESPFLSEQRNRYFAQAPQRCSSFYPRMHREWQRACQKGAAGNSSPLPQQRDCSETMPGISCRRNSVSVRTQLKRQKPEST